MKIATLIFCIGIVAFGSIFYKSFFDGTPFYIGAYSLNSVELIALLYLFLLCMIYLFFQKKRDIFISKEQILNLVSIELLVTAALLYGGYYSFCIVLVFLFFIAVIKSKNIFLLLYLLSLDYALYLLFNGGFYILSFVVFFTSVLFIVRGGFVFTRNDLFIVFVEVFLVSLLFIFADSYLYELYLWLDVTDVAYSLDVEVFLVLSSLQVCIFIFMIMNKKNITNFKIY